MAVTVSDWEAIEALIIADLKANVSVASHSIANINISYRSLSELREQLAWVRQQIRAATPGTTNLSLARVIDA